MNSEDRPNVLIWSVTFACPLRCSHCYTESGQRPPKTLGRDDMLRVADALIKLEPAAISLVGGEPLTLRHIVEVARRFADAGIKVIVYTSGWSVPMAMVRELADVVHRVTVSVDGATAAVHDRIRGRVGSFDRAMFALEQLNAEAASRAAAGLTPLRFSIDYVVTRNNFHQLEEMCARVARRFPRLAGLSFGAVVPSGLASRPSYVAHELISDEQVAQLISQETLHRLRRAAPDSVTVETTDNHEVMMRPDFVATNPDFRPMEVEPDGEVRGMLIYEGTVGSLLEEDPFVLWRKARARWEDPFVLDCLKDVHTRQQWADAIRRIDYRFGTDEVRARIDARPEFVPAGTA